MERRKVCAVISSRFRAIVCREHSGAFQSSDHNSSHIQSLLSGHRTTHCLTWALLAIGVSTFLPVSSFPFDSGHGISGVDFRIDRMVSCDSLSRSSSSVSHHNSVFTVRSAVSSIDWSYDSRHASSSPLGSSLPFLSSRFRAPLMAAAIRTLDITDPQVIVEYPLDAGGFFWHHRILLHRIAPGVWISLTPDLELKRYDLNVQEHMLVGRAAAFPTNQAPYVYAHDPISVAQLRHWRRQAKVMAGVLGGDEILEIEDMPWLIIDPAHSKFGEEVSEDIINDEELFVNIGARGVAMIDGAELFVEQVARTDIQKWKDDRSTSGGDIRLLGNHVVAGKRKLDLTVAVTLMKGDKPNDAGLAGPPVAKEYLTSVAEGPGNLVSYHSEWLRLSGIADSSAVAHSHKNLMEVLRLMHFRDQLDVSSLACGEFLARWAVQIEVAVSRNPRHPDYSGLDIMFGAPTSAAGKAETTTFSEWISAKMKDKSAVFKYEQQFREAEAKAKASSSSAPIGGGGEAYVGGGNRGGGGRGRPKSKVAPAGGTGGAAA